MIPILYGEMMTESILCMAVRRTEEGYKQRWRLKIFYSSRKMSNFNRKMSNFSNRA